MGIEMCIRDSEGGGHDGFGRAIARVEENGAYDRFANVAKNCHVGGTRMFFAVPQPYMGFDAPGERNLGAALLPHESGEAARKLSLVRRWERLVQHFGNGETQHTIAEKFEPLVGFPLASRHRAHMCECRRD